MRAIFLRLLLLFDLALVCGSLTWTVTFGIETFTAGTRLPDTYYQLTQIDIDSYSNLQSLDASPGDYVVNDVLVPKAVAEGFDWDKVRLDVYFLYALLVLVLFFILRWIMLGSFVPFRSNMEEQEKAAE